MSERKKLYVGCGLTQASGRFIQEVGDLKNALSQSWEVMEFLGLTDGTEEDVYQRDIVENVGGCDAFLGVVDEPSTGLGWEMSQATMLNKPTLAVAHIGSRVTRLVLGAPTFHPTMSFRRYENLVEDVPQIVLEEFEPVLFR